MASTSSASVQYDSDIFTNYVPNPNDPTGNPQVIQSYTINLQCFDATSNPMPNASLLVQASSPTIVSLNGQTVMLSVQPFRYALDVSGEIGMIVPSTGWSSPSYTFSFLKDKDGKAVNMPVTTIDPSRKALAIFDNINTGAQLKTTPGRAGTTLYAGTTPPADADLNAAAKAFQDLSAAAKSMPLTPANVQSALDNLKKSPLPNDGWPSNVVQLPANALADPQGAIQSVATQEAEIIARKTHDLQQTMLHSFAGVMPTAVKAEQQTAAQPTTPAQPTTASETTHPDPKLTTKQTHQVKLSVGGFFKGLGNDIKDGFDKGVHGAESLAGTLQKDANGVEHQVMKDSDPAGWVIDSKKSWSYLVKMAGRAWSIVIDHIEDVGKAFEKLWTDIKLGWKEFEMWVGYIFDWKAIVAMQKTIQSSIDSFLDHLVADLKGDRKEFNAAVQTLTNEAKAKLEPSTDTTKASSVTTQKAPGIQGNQSAPGKWFNHHAKHGGLTDVHQVDTLSTANQRDSGDPSDKLNSAMEQIKPLLTKLGHDLASDIGATGDFSMSQAAAHLTDTIFGAVADAFTVVVDEFLDFMADFIDMFKMVGNAKIKVPILSWLYREITGQELTFFAFLSLCAAIIASITYQAFMLARRKGKMPVAAASAVPAKAVKTVARESSKDQDPNHSSNQSPNNTDNQDGSQQNDSFSPFIEACIVFGAATLKGIVVAVAAGMRARAKQTDKGAAVPFLLAGAKVLLGAGMFFSTLKSSGLPRPDLRRGIVYLLVSAGLINVSVSLYQYCNDTRRRLGTRSARWYHVIDMVSATCYFGISSAIFVAERDDTSWKGRDIAQSKAQEVANAFNWAYDVDSAAADMVWEEGDQPGINAPNTNETVGQWLDGVSVLLAVGNIAALAGKAIVAGEHEGVDFTMTAI